MRSSFLRQKTFDWLLVGAPILLTCLGFAAQYSIDLSLQHFFGNSYLRTQLIAAFLGIVFCLILYRTHTHTLYKNSPLIYTFSLLLLIAVLFFGTEIRGTQGWFRIAGNSFQPAELAKISLAMILAWLISRYGRNFMQFRFIAASALLTALPVGLIMLQPDLGSSLVLCCVWFGLLVALQVPYKYTIGTALVGVLAFIIGWFFLFAPYQKERVLTFIDPSRDPLGAGYNVSQSLIAIGSGGFFGRGLGFGSQSQLRFLPEAQTDFVFAVIAEELGFIGSLCILTLFGLFLWRLFIHIQTTRSEFGAYALIAIGFVFFTQFVFNIGGAMGLLPMTGVTLPFVSYGGSSLLISYTLLGITLSISRGEYAV
jgi:rod shape determining protein RodA